MSCAYLVEDGWDDWFKYQTTYSLTVFDDDGRRFDLGLVKIGRSKMPKDSKRPELPETFSQLDKEFFSLGQSEEYYEQLGNFESMLRDAVLRGLRDVVANQTRWRNALKHDVTTTSLLRSVSSKSVTGQFRRLLAGGARLTRFSFQFDSPASSDSVWAVPSLSFEVRPDSLPPSNVHALIGRNGVGKSRLLHVMAKALTQGQRGNHGAFVSLSDEDEKGPLFANVVSVSFSAFDAFPPLDEPTEKARGVKYFYVGLSRSGQNVPRPHAPKTPGMLAKEFASSVADCLGQKRGPRWLRALELLETDPLFKEAEIALLATASAGSSNKGLAESVFQRLSSGHKIVLLTITRLVQVVEEKTLVLIDEPEAHLHPPLLSAFIRALSDLLINRNAVCLIATHSPVVLQEVPRSCAWVLRRSGREVVAERPETETFGEGVGVLTGEVFRLEASQSGFHQLLMAAAREYANYDDALAAFGGSLGAEARAVLQARIVAGGGGTG
ncbi:AAA family ATPase [soil metagenome]